MAKGTLVLTALLLVVVAVSGARSRRAPEVMPRGEVPNPPSSESTIMSEKSLAANAGGVQRMPHVGIPDPNEGSSIRMADYYGAGVDTHFEGIDVTDSTPPDPHFAVGKKGMVMVVNGEISLHAGPPTYQRLEFETLHGFFGYSVNSPVVYDPRAVYNHYEDRYFVIALRGASADTGESSLVMAYSKTDEPQSLDIEEDWIFSAIDTDIEVPPNGLGYELWADYPTLGYDEYNAYVGFNMFQILSSSGPIHAKLFAIQWSEIKEGKAEADKTEWMRLQGWDDSSTTDLSFTPQPAIRYHTPGATTDHYTVSHASDFGSRFLIYRTRNPHTSSPVTKGSSDNAAPDVEPEVIDISIAVNECGEAFSSASSLDGNQADSDIDLDIGDSRLMSSFHRADLGLLYTVVTTKVNSVYSGILVVGFNTTTENTTCLETHVIADSSNGNATLNWYFGYPAVAITDEGDIAVSFTGVRESSYGSVFTAYKVNGTWSAPLMVMEGQRPYTRLASATAGSTRWGDYSQMVLDPNDGTRVWGFVQYAGADPEGEDALFPDQFWTTRAFSYQLCSTCTIGGCAECENTSPCFLGECVCDAGRQGEGYDCPNLCPQLCFADEGRGTCNYLDRTCTCNSGWVGDACENADPVTLFIFMGVLFVVVVSMMTLFSACHPEYASFGEQ